MESIYMYPKDRCLQIIFFVAIFSSDSNLIDCVDIVLGTTY